MLKLRQEMIFLTRKRIKTRRKMRPSRHKMNILTRKTIKVRRKMKKTRRKMIFLRVSFFFFRRKFIFSLNEKASIAHSLLAPQE